MFAWQPLAAAGAPSSYNVDLASEYATKIGALEAKMTAGTGRGSALREGHRKVVSVGHQLGFGTHFNQVLSSNETGGEGERKKSFSDKTRAKTFIFSLKPES